MHTQRELKIASSIKTESILSEEFGSKDAPEQKTAAHAAQVSHAFICKNRKKNLEKKKKIELHHFSIQNILRPLCSKIRVLCLPNLTRATKKASHIQNVCMQMAYLSVS